MTAQVQRFKKKPVEIKAIQFTGDNAEKIIKWAGSHRVRDSGPPRHGFYWLKITTLEGTMTAHPGDWIIRGVEGEIYPCKPDIFEKTYEPVD